MKKIYTLVFGLIFLYSCEYSNVQYIDVDRATNENIKLAQSWIDNLLSNNLEDVKSSMHKEFSFVYMGITENVNGPYGKGGVSYGKEDFFSDYWPIVGELLPNGIVLKTIDTIADTEGVALIQEGDAEGINGEYDNKYVFVYKFKDGKILSINEYNSDLLVATKLYKNKLVPFD